MSRQKYSDSIRRLFTENLAVKKNEHILIFTDLISPGESISAKEKKRRKKLLEISRLIASEGKKFTHIIFHTYPATGSHGAEPPLSLWKSAFDKKTINEFIEKKILSPIIHKTASGKEIIMAHKIIESNRLFRKIDGIIALSWFSTTHTRFRKLLTESYRARYASMPLFEPDMLSGPMDTDLKKLKERTVLLAGLLTDAVKALITSPDGTHLSFSLKGRSGVADTGSLETGGTVSNLPAGEAYVAPLENTAEGKLIAKYAPSRKLKEPLILSIKDGKIKRILGEKEKKDQLNNVFNKFPKARILAEFGIGTNEKAKRPDNILESEKILGTVHIAFGDNSTFGGKNCVPFHEDFVIFEPTVKLSLPGNVEKTIIKNGKLLI